jgi:hypothetical protein
MSPTSWSKTKTAYGAPTPSYAPLLENTARVKHAKRRWPTFGSLDRARGRVRRPRRADAHHRRHLMSPVPSLPGDRVVRTLERAGFGVV